MTTIAQDAVPCPVPLLTPSTVSHPEHAERAGELTRVTRGVYAPTALWQALAPWDRYLARVHAAALRYPDATFILESGAALRGLPVFGEPPQVHVILPRPTTARAFSRVMIHTRERPPQTNTLAGLRVATATEIVVETARLRHPAVALAIAGTALRTDAALTSEHFAEVNDQLPSPRGRQRAHWVFDRATPVPESTLENVSLATIEWLGFERPELQRWVRGSHPGDDDRVDFLWERHRIAGEADGEVKYSGAYGDARAALRARNARDARLLARGIAATAHWAWGDVIAHPQLRAILFATGLRPERPEARAPLSTLAAALRGIPPVRHR